MEGWNVGDYNLVADVESSTATTLDELLTSINSNNLTPISWAPWPKVLAKREHCGVSYTLRLTPAQ